MITMNNENTKLDPPQLCIVVPCYNEVAVLPVSAKTLGELLIKMMEHGEVKDTSYICFVNDGSSDATWECIKHLMNKSTIFRGINLSRNFGHQGALLAGLFTARAEAYVSIDADLQDDEQKIREMVQLYCKGHDIVYGCRDNRDTDTWFKRMTAEVFYKLRSKMGVNTISNHADFRLMSFRAVEAFKKYGEVNLFIRGIIPMLGFPSAKVFYMRKARELGEAKYPLRKMVRLAWDGLVNFTDIPLIACLIAGILGCCISVLLIFWALYCWRAGNALPGWTSLLIVVCFSSSLQFVFMGIIGLYTGKVLLESKHRPVFIIQDDLSNR